MQTKRKDNYRMEIQKVNLVYFSATNTTQRVVRTIAQGTAIENVIEYNVTKNDSEEKVSLSANELLIVGVPVYSGRIPEISIASLNRFKGNNTPAIIVCLYGNREYDDALLELKDLISSNGFKVVTAAVFIGTHSIFPDVAVGRPSDVDLVQAHSLGQRIAKQLVLVDDVKGVDDIEVTGNRPYRDTKKIPLRPTGDKTCDNCGTCVKLCPTGAIDSENPRKTNKELCIACARCIAICPQKARNFRGIIYSIAKRKFVKAYSDRKNNEIIVAI